MSDEKRGKFGEPWELATSCSWRRVIDSDMEPAIMPTVLSDGYPDIYPVDRIKHAVACVNAIHASGLPLSVLPLVPELIEAADEMRQVAGQLLPSELNEGSLPNRSGIDAYYRFAKVIARIAAATEGEG